jgi:hypothetical protein
MQNRMKRLKALKRLLAKKLSGVEVPKIPKLPRGIPLGIALLIAVSVFSSFKDRFNIQGPMVLDAQTVLLKVQSFGIIATSRYTFSSQVNGEIDMPEFLKPLYGQSQQLMVTGDIVAGVDATKAFALKSPTALWQNPIILVFPKADIVDCILNEGKTFVSADQRGLFAAAMPSFSQKMRQFAIKHLVDAANSIDIKNSAQLQAESVLRDLFEKAGLNIKIEFSVIGSELPASCQ